MTQTADTLICGAGIAGIAACLSSCCDAGCEKCNTGRRARPPLSLTSDKSTEAYRNWWPGPDDSMVRYMNRAST